MSAQPRVVNLLGGREAVDLDAQERQKQREYNNTYYKKVRAKKLKDNRRMHAAIEFIAFLEAQDVPPKAAVWFKAVVLKARLRFGRGLGP